MSKGVEFDAASISKVRAASLRRAARKKGREVRGVHATGQWGACKVSISCS